MASNGRALEHPLTESGRYSDSSRPSRNCFKGIAVLMAVVLGACVSQEPPSKLQRNAEAYCREQGLRPGTDDFEACVEKTREEIIARARGSYQRLIRGEGR